MKTLIPMQLPFVFLLSVATGIGQAPDAVKTYRPKAKGDIHDLRAPAADILRGLPGVTKVEVLVSSPKPTQRIIHIRDWHYVPPDLFALDVRDEAKKPLSDKEVETLYRKHLQAVESVQQEQETILRCLVEHHGLKQVLLEKVTPKNVGAYRGIIPVLREMGEMLGDLRDSAPELKALGGQHRMLLLQYGASCRLVMENKLKVFPLDDDDLLEKAKPVTKDGRIKFDPERVEARRDGQVRAALKSGSCSLLILGGAHDLSGSVKWLGKGKVEYIRVTTRQYERASGLEQEKEGE